MTQTRSTEDRPGFGLGLDSRRWAALWLAGGIACGALTGCRSAGPLSRSKAEPTTATTTTTTTSMPSDNPMANKTDFHKDVAPDQGFNVHVELGRVYEAQGNFEAAVAEYDKALEFCDKKGSLAAGAKLGPPQRALAERRLAAAYDRMGKFTQAEAHYGKALDAAPKDSKTWNDVGYSYYLQNRLADAERSFKTADSIDPNNPKVLTNLGLALAASGKTEEALAALSRAGGPAVGHANLGFILAAMGKTSEAKAQYEAALAAQPELTAARNALAQLDSQARQVPVGAIAANAAPPPPPAPTASGPAEVQVSTPKNDGPAPDASVVSASAPIAQPVVLPDVAGTTTVKPTPNGVPIPVPTPIAVVPVNLPVAPLDQLAPPANAPVSDAPKPEPVVPAPAPAPAAPEPSRPTAPTTPSRPAEPPLSSQESPGRPKAVVAEAKPAASPVHPIPMPAPRTDAALQRTSAERVPTPAVAAPARPTAKTAPSNRTPRTPW